MFSLPNELILHIIDFDDNEYYKKQFNKCLTELKQIKYKSKIVEYLKPLYLYYDIYYDRVISSKLTPIGKCSKYILTNIMRKRYNNAIIINDDYLTRQDIKPSLIYSSR